MIIRSATGLTDTYFHLNPAGSNSAGIGPEGYDCNQYQWSTAEAARKMGEEFQHRSIQSLKTADVEFVGVRPVLNKIARCEFDAMRVTANQQEKIAEVTVSDSKQDSSISIKSVTVTVNHAKPSNLARCKQQPSFANYPQTACTMSGVRNTSLVVYFKVTNNEEIARLNIRPIGILIGYWKEGFLPGKNLDLEGLRGKKVTLLNISLSHPRAKEYFFERLVD